MLLTVTAQYRVCLRLVLGDEGQGVRQCHIDLGEVVGGGGRGRTPYYCLMLPEIFLAGSNVLRTGRRDAIVLRVIFRRRWRYSLQCDERCEMQEVELVAALAVMLRWTAVRDLDFGV